MFKIGSQLFCAAGPEFVRELVNQGEEIFLDLKFHDIPNTVAAAAVAVTRLGVSIFNVHAAGGREMMERTGAAVREIAVKEGLKKPAVIAVTVLTSSNAPTLTETGVSNDIDDQVRRLALLTETAGLDGVVASPLEIALVRSAVPRDNFVLVTPGVRFGDSLADDQKRTMSPRMAVAAGADYLVVGRPILADPDPARAAERIVAEIALGLAG
jgi:orotidine-5'-phosphate decarboxylase